MQEVRLKAGLAREEAERHCQTAHAGSDAVGTEPTPPWLTGAEPVDELDRFLASEPPHINVGIGEPQADVVASIDAVLNEDAG